MPLVCDRDPDLHRLLDSVEDTREIVARRTDEDDVLRAAWRGAREDAVARWSAWSAGPDRDAWAAYLAAQDREDAALDALLADAVA